MHASLCKFSDLPVFFSKSLKHKFQRVPAGTVCTMTPSGWTDNSITFNDRRGRPIPGLRRNKQAAVQAKLDLCPLSYVEMNDEVGEVMWDPVKSNRQQHTCQDEPLTVTYLTEGLLNVGHTATEHIVAGASYEYCCMMP